MTGESGQGQGSTKKTKKKTSSLAPMHSYFLSFSFMPRKVVLFFFLVPLPLAVWVWGDFLCAYLQKKHQSDRIESQNPFPLSAKRKEGRKEGRPMESGACVWVWKDNFKLKQLATQPAITIIII
ncbi:hypothetical protein TWF718_008159 [Orbilia javanica]|uniref:Uncharacterized protein n=1 Tax=Orbilia javanica TaxID=47235 RepID=A0AAN8MWK8_9PEZI